MRIRKGNREETKIVGRRVDVKPDEAIPVRTAVVGRSAHPEPSAARTKIIGDAGVTKLEFVEPKLA